MRRAIVHDWDQYQQLTTDYPQIGRWLPGYTHCLWTICQGWYGYSDQPTPYPKVTLRDSFDIYPGFGLEPDDVMVLRKVPLRVLKAHYPDVEWGQVESALQKGTLERGISAWSSAAPHGYSRWEGPDTGIEVVEYMDAAGRSLLIPDASMPLSFTENPLWPEPPFVVMRRYSFNANISAYHHVIGLVAMMAKLNILGLVASQDSVFRETNVTGEVESGEYRFGRGVVNILSPAPRWRSSPGTRPRPCGRRSTGSSASCASAPPTTFRPTGSPPTPTPPRRGSRSSSRAPPATSSSTSASSSWAPSASTPAG